MTIQTLARPTQGEAAADRRERGLRLPIIDSDVHPTVAAVSEMRPYLSERWWRYFQSYGARPKHGFAQGDPFPKAAPRAARRDAWTPDGKPPGSDLELMRSQYLDALGVEYGILAPLFPTGQGDRNPEFSAAICSAVNDWQRDKWTRPERRLKASIVIALRGPAGGDRRDRALRRRPRLRPDPDAGADLRAARQPALLADLRQGGRGRAAGRRARLRLRRPSGHRSRLAVLLRRGDDRPFRRLPGRRREPRAAGRVRALPGPESDHDRGRLRLARVACCGGSTGIGRATARRCRTSPGRRRRACARACGSAPSRWRSPSARASCST